MYAGPRPKPLPSALRVDDPSRAEFEHQMSELRREDAARAAYEGVAEFGPIAHCDRDEIAWDRMVADGDDNERLHDRHGFGSPEQIW
jgi:hypothetical protein